MTKPPHLFIVYRQPGSESWILARLKPHPVNQLLQQTSEVRFRWDVIGDCQKIVDFISDKRTKDEPAVFDILRDLFPDHREALDRVECELLMKPILEAAEPPEKEVR